MLKQRIQRFRIGRHQGIAAFIGDDAHGRMHRIQLTSPAARVNKKELVIEEVEVVDKVDIDVLAEDLPENSPRFVILHYAVEHDDGRKSFPLVLINWAPSGSEVGMMTLHASAFILFQELVCDSTPIMIDL